MNDFTKEELEETLRCLDYMTRGGITPYSLVTMQLKKKIRKIIERYCEHKEKYTDFDCAPSRCKKCMELIDE